MWWSRENFVQRAMPFGRGEFAANRAFCAHSAQKYTLWPDINRRVCRGQFLWAEARAKCFFAAYTPPQKTDSILFAALRHRELGETSLSSKKGRPSGFTGGAAFFVCPYFFLARERMTSSVTMHSSIVMSMSGRVLPTMMSTFISRRYSTKPITQMMRLRTS